MSPLVGNKTVRPMTANWGRNTGWIGCLGLLLRGRQVKEKCALPRTLTGERSAIRDAR